MKRKYLLNRTDFLFEARDNRFKIKKFIDIDKVVEYAHDIDKNYSIWIANCIKDNAFGKLKDNKDLKELDFNEKMYNNFLKGKYNIDNNEHKIIMSIIDKELDKSMRDLKDSIRYVIDWVNGHFIRTGERIDLKNYTLSNAFNASKEWHEEIEKGGTGIIIGEEDGTVIKTFEDGYYWIDLETNYCSDEAEAMGHCGTSSNYSTLLSLRKDKRPYVTVECSKDYSEINQMKGRGNTKPVEKYHKYIVALLTDPEIGVQSFNYTYNMQDDFVLSDLTSEQITEVLTKNETLKDHLDNYSLLKLYIDKHITARDVESQFNDIIYIEDEDKFYLNTGETEFNYDLLEIVLSDSADISENFLKSALEFDTNGVTYASDLEFEKDIWEDLSIDTYKHIRTLMLDTYKNTPINYEGEEFMISEDTLIIDEENKKLLFNIADEIYNFEDILWDIYELEGVTNLLDRVYIDGVENSITDKAYNYLTDFIVLYIAEEKDAYKWANDLIDNSQNNLLIEITAKRIAELLEMSDSESNEYGSVIDIIKYADDKEKLSYIPDHELYSDYKYIVSYIDDYIYEHELDTDLNESFLGLVKGTNNAISKLFHKSIDFTKDIWTVAKREGSNTNKAFIILRKMMRGEKVTEQEIEFFKAQRSNILKLIPIVAIQGLPMGTVALTPILRAIEKRYKIDIFPKDNSNILA